MWTRPRLWQGVQIHVTHCPCPLHRCQHGPHVRNDQEKMLKRMEPDKNRLTHSCIIMMHDLNFRNCNRYKSTNHERTISIHGSKKTSAKSFAEEQITSYSSLPKSHHDVIKETISNDLGPYYNRIKCFLEPKI